MKKILISFFSLIMLFSSLIPAVNAVGIGDAVSNANTTASKMGYKVENTTGQGVQNSTLVKLVSKVIKILLSLLGVIFLLLIIYGGFKWMLARGNTDDVSKAKAIIVDGVVGMLIILSAYVITSTVMDVLLNKLNIIN